MGKATAKDEIPLQTQVDLEPFEKWGMDFIGTIDPPLGELVTDKGAQFTSHLIKKLLRQHHIKHIKSTSYHPQANGQVKVIIRVLEGILTKVVSSKKIYLANRLVEATWAYNTTWKTTTGFTPYELVYGKKALLSIEFEYNTLRMVAQLDLDVTKAQ
eukprot:PITA_04014